SLANKCQLLFGLAVLLILTAALSVPWFRMQIMIDEGQFEVADQLAEALIAGALMPGPHAPGSAGASASLTPLERLAAIDDHIEHARPMALPPSDDDGAAGSTTDSPGDDADRDTSSAPDEPIAPSVSPHSTAPSGDPRHADARSRVDPKTPNPDKAVADPSPEVAADPADPDHRPRLTVRWISIINEINAESDAAANGPETGSPTANGQSSASPGDARLFPDDPENNVGAPPTGEEPSADPPRGQIQSYTQSRQQAHSAAPSLNNESESAASTDQQDHGPERDPFVRRAISHFQNNPDELTLFVAERREGQPFRYRYARAVRLDDVRQPWDTAPKTRAALDAASVRSRATDRGATWAATGSTVAQPELSEERGSSQAAFRLTGIQPWTTQPLMQEIFGTTTLTDDVPWNASGRPGDLRSLVEHRHLGNLMFPSQEPAAHRPYHAATILNETGDTATAAPSSPASVTDQPSPLLGILVIDHSAETARGQLIINRMYIILAGLFAGALAILVFYFITTRLILSPVRVLRETAERVSRGELYIRSDISTGDEFEDLSDAFNHMLANWTGSQNQLRQINKSLDLKLNELSESNTLLVEANRLKSEFLANVSHELRTPLNSILGFAEVIQEMEADAADLRSSTAGADNGSAAEKKAREKRYRYAGNILRSGRSLLDLINDLLDLAKIEAGRLEVAPEPTSVEDVCEGLATLIRPQAEKKQIKIEVRVSRTMPMIHTDPAKFQQILFNFLSNAVKFTPVGGSVTVAADRQRRREYGEVVRICVTDTGPGISERDQALIFEKFHQVDGGHSRETEGTGLGLTICRELSQLLGGWIEVESELGRGSTFTLFLPPHLTPDRPQSLMSAGTKNTAPAIGEGSLLAGSSRTADPHDDFTGSAGRHTAETHPNSGSPPNSLM
ncbi:MAG: ATP-binding protein, partial [Planctomycetota bacterium]